MRRLYFYDYRLLSEIADVLGDRKEVRGDDLDKLKYTKQVWALMSQS